MTGDHHVGSRMGKVKAQVEDRALLQVEERATGQSLDFLDSIKCVNTYVVLSVSHQYYLYCIFNSRCLLITITTLFSFFDSIAYCCSCFFTVHMVQNNIF